MKNVKTWKLATLTALLSGSAFAAPLQWECNWPEARAQAFSLYQGETATFEPTFRVNGAIATNVAVEAVYYQTNGMGSAWWRLDGRDFAPSNDCGAASYRFFVAASDTGGKVYRANGTLRMLPSPGFTPNEITPPVVALDFASIAVANAPYYTKDETDERIVVLAPVPGNYAAVSNAAMTAATAATNHTDAVSRNFLPLAGGKMRGNIDMGGSYGGANAADSAFLEFLDWRFGNGVLGSGFGIYQHDGDVLDVRYLFNGARWYDELGDDADVMTREDLADALSDIDLPVPDLTGYATHAQATNAARAVSAPLEENVGVLWQYVLGDTVWFAVTNYMRTVEGVVPSLQFWEVRDGATNLVYHSTEEVSNIVNAATAALRADLTNSLADRAWSKYQSATGADNPQPGDITIVSTPSIMMTGGGEWNRYVHTGGSSVWVLRSNGLTTFGGGSNGSFFAVQDDEGNTQFEVRRTDSYEVDALPSATGFDGDDFQVTYNLPASGNPPTLYASTNLATTAFAAEENGSIDSLGIDVTWAAAGGLWRATIVQDVKAPALFVHAKALQEGSIVVKNNAPTSLSGGIFIGNTKYSIGTATISGHTVLTLTPAP